MQLVKYEVKLVDIYGIIGSQEVNTLEHLNIKYDWSVYSPTKKAEILEAERAKDEMRDIMTRMIGAEIRYVRLGFRVRQPPFGYENKKVETSHGKRVILEPHPQESVWIRKMFELRARGTLNDHQIVDEVNALGFRTRKMYKRNPKDRTKVIGEIGNKPLTVKHLWIYIQNPIYAGINIEKWTEGQPVKTKFDGLVSYELFNKANKGKRIITEEKGEVRFWKHTPKEWLLRKQVKNPNFPYKRYVLCPHCHKPLFGSASRGKLGKYYPAYHCNKRGHYFRVPSKDFETTIAQFVRNLDITPNYIDQLKTLVLDLWNQRQEELQDNTDNLDIKILELRAAAQATAEKIRYLSSEIAIKYMEADLIKLEGEINELEASKVQMKAKDGVDMEVVMNNISYFLEHQN